MCPYVPMILCGKKAKTSNNKRVLIETQVLLCSGACVHALYFFESNQAVACVLTHHIILKITTI